MMTTTPASATARGSPARIVSPNVPARTAIQRSREAVSRDSVSRSTLSSCTGTQLMPATSPRWATWAGIAPAKANETAPSRLGRLPRRSARRKKNMPSPATAQVTIMLSVQAAVPGRTANRNVRGYAAAAFQPASNGAPPQIYGSYSGSWPPRICRPARTRSGKFCVWSSPGRTACPSSAGTPKMITGSAMRTATASRSLRRCPDARAPGTGMLVILVVSDSSGPTTRTLAAEAERILGGGRTWPAKPQADLRSSGARDGSPVPGDQRGLVQRRDLLPVEPITQPLGLRLKRGPPGRPWIPRHDQLDPPGVVLHIGADDLAVPPGGGAAVAGPVEDGCVEVRIEVEVALLPAHRRGVERRQQRRPRLGRRLGVHVAGQHPAGLVPLQPHLHRVQVRQRLSHRALGRAEPPHQVPLGHRAEGAQVAADELRISLPCLAPA